MPTEKELGLKVEDWMGINRQLSEEDLQSFFYRQTLNLYERKIGELQRRGGSALLPQNTIPGNISSIDGETVVYDKVLGKTKLCKVTCTKQNSTFTYPGLSASFVTDVANGKWGSAPVGITNGYIGCAQPSNARPAVSLVATGFGVYARALSVTASLPVSGDTKKLQVVLATPLADKNVTALHVYAQVIFCYVGGVAQYVNMYVGYIDVVNNPTGTFNFNNGPITLGADPGAPQEVGHSSPLYVPATQNSGGGLLIPGKTYFVAVMAHRLKYDATFSNCRSHWYTQLLGSITIPPGANSIILPVTSGTSAATFVAIGLHPQLMRPVGVQSQGAAPTITILDLPKNQPFVVGVDPADATHTNYIFTQGDIGVDDMLAKLDTSNWIPIPINNLNTQINSDTNWSSLTMETWVGGNSSLTVTAPSAVSSGGVYTFDNYNNQGQDLSFGVSRSGLNQAPIIGIQHNIMQTDGYGASMITLDFGTATPARASYIKFYKERMGIAGGATSDAYNKTFFSNAFNPYSFGVPGLVTVAQYIQVESGGEEINGFAIYTNTTGLSGPIAQLLICKKNSIYLLTDWPVYTSTSNNNATLVQLSKKTGCANNATICNTDIGTIITSKENVWLIRESGEPTPLGNEISFLLRPEDPNVAVDTTFWNAVFHDGKYKLSYSVNGAQIPNQELWLDIQKLKQLKGQPAWFGPMSGREVRYSMVEEAFLDTIIAKRICVDASNKRWYQADKEDVLTDFGTDLSFTLETKPLPGQDTNANKLFTRMYWRMKVDQTFTFSETLKVLNEAGEQSYTQNRIVHPLTGYATNTGYANFVSSCRAKLYQFFPVGRARGENVKLTWSYTGPVLFTISAFTSFFTTERRRPGL